MLKLQTPVTDTDCKTGISYSDKILLIGSCFSDNIGTMLRNYGFNACVNPFGTLYNPASVNAGIRRLTGTDLFSEDDCIEIGAGDLRICSFHHHTTFARNSKEEFIRNANEKLSEARTFFKECNKVIITLGTSWCYRHLEKDMIVSNCLKRNPKEFVREFLPSATTAELMKGIMEICPDKEFIFTVSPIRHFKDGAHGNQLSKASLLLGINETGAEYFPAYEIMMDQLRDYRFYAEDMCHPSHQAVGYICERFLDWALPENEHEMLKENIRTWRHGCHIANK